MRKTVNYELTYFKKGEELKKIVPIKFVSNRIYDWYSDIMDRTNKLQGLVAQRKKLIEDLAMVIVDKDVSILKRREKSKPIKAELKEVEKQISECDSKDFVTARHKIIERLLNDNGIDDPELLSLDFWNDNIEPSELWGFLVAAVTKDTEGKKKVM